MRRWLELTAEGFSFKPQTTAQAFEMRGELAMPARIKFKRDGKFCKVLGSERASHEAAA
jgi:hypothetical protein